MSGSIRTGENGSPTTWSPCLTGCLLLRGGLFALRMQFSGRDLDPRGSAVSALGPPLGIVLIFQAIQMTWRLVYGLPVFYMGKKGIAFPHLNRRVLSWDNLKDIEAVETPRLLFFKKSSLTLEMHVPERIAFGSLNQLLSFGPRSTAFVPLLAGWPVSAVDLRDLILLGRETWIADGRPNVPSPTPEETEFDRVVQTRLRDRRHHRPGPAGPPRRPAPWLADGSGRTYLLFCRR